MVNEELISFRLWFRPCSFPVEAHFYQYGQNGASYILNSLLISSRQELDRFQKEVTVHEEAHEWCFLAYYKPLLSEQADSAEYSSHSGVNHALSSGQKEQKL